MQYKVIALDLDGTLISTNSQILSENVNTLKIAQNNGIEIIIVTGRHHTAASPYYYTLNLSNSMVCCNGAYTYNAKTQTLNDVNLLTREMANYILQLAKQFKLNVLVYTTEAMLYETENSIIQSFKKLAETSPKNFGPIVQQIKDYDTLISDTNNIIKVVASSEDVELLKQFYKKLDLTTYSAEFSWSNRLDITSSGNSKGKALLNILTKQQIKPEETIAFGDQMNDISMLEMVGLGVAMGNAQDAVKNKANLITTDNTKAGISQVISEYLNI